MTSWDRISASRVSINVAISCCATICACFSLAFEAQSQANSCAENATATARRLNLAGSSRWAALLHFKNGEPLIHDSAFFLTSFPHSTERELDALIRLACDVSNGRRLDVLCKFPARFHFIREELSPYAIQFSEASCPQFDEYLQLAPAEEIGLVFAAENVTHPMSMLGHVFLKLSGDSVKGGRVHHAATFFARFEGVSLAQLAVDSLFTGIDSFFALTPYRKQLAYYKYTEGRNVWEYPLNLSTYERELIHRHIFELKEIDAPYLFLDHNCASVVQFLLAIGRPSLADCSDDWMSPAEVVRSAEANNLFTERRFIPSIDWQIRTLRQSLSDEEAMQVESAVANSNRQFFEQLTRSRKGAISIAYARAVVERLISSEVDDEVRISFLQKMNELSSTIGQTLESTSLPDPLLRPKLSQFSLGVSQLGQDAFFRVELLPVSHTLLDRNPNSHGESSLRLGRLALLARDDTVRIDELDLYSFESFTPYDRIAGGRVVRLETGIERQINRKLQRFRAGHVTAGFGLAGRFTSDILFASSLNLGGAYGDESVYAFVFPEVSMTLNAIGQMKSVGSLRWVCGEGGSGGCYGESLLQHQVPLTESLAIAGAVREIWNQSRTTSFFEISLKSYF